MTNYEHLLEVIHSGSMNDFYEWLEAYSNFYDPGGWFDDENVKINFLNTEWNPSRVHVDDELDKCKSCIHCISGNDPICNLRVRYASDCLDNHYSYFGNFADGDKNVGFYGRRKIMWRI
mgnify:CR=1 FL=1